MRKFELIIIKTILVLSCAMLSILAIAICGRNIGAAITFIAVTGTALTLDSLK